MEGTRKEKKEQEKKIKNMEDVEREREKITNAAQRKARKLCSS